MKPIDLVVRCYANKAGNQWQAFCLDFTLAAQADSFEEAKEKLHDMIDEYVFDILVGEDKAFADRLLFRRAPPYYWAQYYWYVLVARYGNLREDVRHLFTLLVPLVPSSPYRCA